MAIHAVAVAPDGRVFSAGDEGLVHAENPAGGDSVVQGRVISTGPITALALTPDGRVISGDTNGWATRLEPDRP